MNREFSASKNSITIHLREVLKAQEVFSVKYRIAITLVFLGALLRIEAKNNNDTKSELRAREAHFNQVLLRSDWKALEQIEADDLIFTNSDGSVTHRSDDVANLRSGNLTFAAIDMSDVTVQDLGNVAVVTGQLVERARYKMTDISATYRFTDVWDKKDGKWRLVTGQETIVQPSK